MPIKIADAGLGRTVTVELEGKLTKDDYERFLPLLERRIERHGTIDLVLLMDGMDGMEPGAVWEDLKFDVRHLSDVGRLAVVGNKRWHEWTAKFSKPFTSAEVKFYETKDVEEAKRWAGREERQKATG